MTRKLLIPLAMLIAVAALALWPRRQNTTPPSDPAAAVMQQAMSAAAPGEIPPMPQTTFCWSPPSTGSPVAYYEIESRDAWDRPASCVPARTAGPDTCISYPETYIWHQIRVRGVDGDGRAGPWSEWALQEPYLSTVVRFTNQLRRIMDRGEE